MSGFTRKALTVILLSTATVMFAGCVPTMRAPVEPPTSIIFTSIKAPMNTSFCETETGGRVGMSSAYTVLGIISVGDASVRAAAVNGGIDKVNHADYQYLNVLGVFNRFTTIVYGK